MSERQSLEEQFRLINTRESKRLSKEAQKEIEIYKVKHLFPDYRHLYSN